MKNAWMALSVLFLLFLCSPVFGGSAQLGDLRLSLIEGDVQIRTDDTGDWVAASSNFPLLEGDRIWVPDDGRAEIQTRNGTFIRLDRETSLELVSVEQDAAQVYLAGGRAYLNFSGRGDSVIQTDTPGVMVRAFDPAKFMVDVDSYGDTEVSVIRGVVLVDTREGRVRVSSGGKLIVRDDGSERARLGRGDEWERWNADRDRRYADTGRSRYLPEELREYDPEFSENGRWVYSSDYGYVWTPTVHISIGWSPYRHGRWVWRGGDYVWISYERWGWVPYHYGRWSFVVNIGWCWVPPQRGQVYWGPGYVGWVSTPTYVAWVPLAPGEIYYGYGNYGPQSVNIANINVSTTVVNVYRNVHVDKAVITVHRDTFVRGRHADVPVKGNPFLSEKIHVGRPAIPPEKASSVPVIREIPEKKRPPRYVREERPREIREARRLHREKTAPVVRPEVFERTQEEQRKLRGQEAPKVRVREQEQPVEKEPSRKDGDKERGIKEQRREEQQKQRVRIRDEGKQPVSPASPRQDREDTEKRAPRERVRGDGSVGPGPEPAGPRAVPAQPKSRGRTDESPAATQAPAEKKTRAPQVEQQRERMPEQSVKPLGRGRQVEQAPQRREVRPETEKRPQARGKEREQVREQKDGEPAGRRQSPAEEPRTVQPEERKEKREQQERTQPPSLKEPWGERNGRTPDLRGPNTEEEKEQGRKGR
ncbi:MAG: FecR domain-containing protein [Thermodesulfovibrionales bacterium]